MPAPIQVTLDMTDSMGPGKLVRHMQNLSYTYDEYLICIRLGPSISSVICKNLSYSGPSYPSSPVLHKHLWPTVDHDHSVHTNATHRGCTGRILTGIPQCHLSTRDDILILQGDRLVVVVAISTDSLSLMDLASEHSACPYCSIYV